MEEAECSTDIDDHIHCLFCYQIKCSYKKCKIIKCTECFVPLHTCKLDDHLTICPKARVHCLNVLGGCPLVLRRDRIGSHLEHCCASVVQCAIQWNRRVLSEYAKRKMKRIAKGLDKALNTPASIDPAEIDLHTVIADQNIIMESYRTSRKDRKHLTDFINPIHPLMPLRISLEPQKSFADEDSSDEEKLMKEKLLKKRKSPFENCYLCKIDPASQHLHTLGNFIETNDDDVDMKVSSPDKAQKSHRPIPAFYAQRNLYIDLVCEHLSAFASKGESMTCFGAGISVYTFCCNESFRRDEYPSHMELCHIDSDEYIGRCPLYIDGCPFYYYKRKPKWGTLRYSQFLSAIVHCAPELPIKLPYTGPSLSDLPEDVLAEIVRYLDSSSLRCLASTNRQLRQLFFKNFANRGMVHLKWERCETNNWTEKCFVWEFSKCQQRITEWENQPSSIVSDHLAKCQLNILKKYTAKKVLALCIQPAAQQ